MFKIHGDTCQCMGMEWIFGKMHQILLSIFLSSWLFGSAPALPDLFSLAHERGDTARLMLFPRQFMLNRLIASASFILNFSGV